MYHAAEDDTRKDAAHDYFPCKFGSIKLQTWQSIHQSGTPAAFAHHVLF